MRRLLAVMLVAAVVALGIGWLAVAGLQRFLGPDPVPPAPADAASRVEPERKIQASLFFVSEDGMRLVAVQRDVPYAEGTTEQARRLVEEQLKDAPAPYAQAIPAGTSLRAVFLTERGDAFVDLSPEIAAGHTGGSLDELFAVYAVVNALTVNLPAIGRVQILVDGKEVDSLAGHIDLRRPLPRSLTWVTQPDRRPESPAPQPAPGAATPAAPPGAPAARPSA